MRGEPGETSRRAAGATDSAGFGRVSLNRSVSLIAAPGVFAGIGVGAGGVSAVAITGSGARVVLRGLTLKGQGGLYGVNLTDGDSLTLENVTVSGFSAGHGVRVAAPARVRLIDTTVRDSGTGLALSQGASAIIARSRLLANGLGVCVDGDSVGAVTAASLTRSLIAGLGPGVGGGVEVVSGSAGASARAQIGRSTVSGTSVGVRAVATGGGSASAALAHSKVAGNGTGVQISGGVARSAGNNTFADNGADVDGVLTPLAAQ